MDTYAKIVDGQLRFAPKSYKASDGRTIINFNLCVEDMTAEGFKPISYIDMPELEVGYYFVPEYYDAGDRIEQNWDKREVPKTPEELEEIERQILEDELEAEEDDGEDFTGETEEQDGE